MAGERFGFPKSARLLDSSQFKRVLSKGRKHFTPALILYVAPGEGEHSRLGLTVSRKVGKAVVRNRIKRMARESFRLRRAQFARIVDCVLVARSQAAAMSKPELAQRLNQLLAGSLEKHR